QLWEGPRRRRDPSHHDVAVCAAPRGGDARVGTKTFANDPAEWILGRTATCGPRWRGGAPATLPMLSHAADDSASRAGRVS
ncbi:MAG TPA: hypothetical protein PKA88_30255, partial [Polyangiaceae bacterium]|nr:hypothetical protein [Polyangiaceae bacterium]